jgi:protein-S-isoprenylcysteine O-methyltransferase Ste14
MKAQPFEFRFRFLIHFVIILLGFTAPWERFLSFDRGLTAWLFLAAWPTRYHWLSFNASTITLLVFGTLCALVAASLRTWASAYIGASVVQDSSLHGERVVAVGPYRYLRNPLYVGLFLHVLALALLMPPTGALFMVIAIGLFELRLIAIEEVFLARTAGEPYRAYCAKVPRLLPALAPRVPSSGAAPRWSIAFLSEIYMWGVAITFLAVGWRYNSFLIMQGVIVSLGLLLIVRAIIRKPSPDADDLTPIGSDQKQ